jgi:hypothetical protein
MMSANFTYSLKLCVVFLASAFLTDRAQAQEAGINEVHWAYSAYFGTGWYQVSGDRDVFVLRMTPRWNIRDADYSADGDKTIGIELRFPITLGLDRFDLDNLPDAVDLDNVASISVTPQVDITIPVTARWSLRPYAAVGWGTVLSGDESSWTYWGGVKSHYSFKNGNLDWALINSVSYVGYTPSEGESEYFLPLMAGLEFDYPFGERKLAGEQLMLSWHGMYTSFESNLDFILDEGPLSSTEAITDQWEFGISLRKQTSPIKIWFMNFDRLGLAYRFSSSGDLKGISFVFRSMFER